MENILIRLYELSGRTHWKNIKNIIHQIIAFSELKLIYVYGLDHPLKPGVVSIFHKKFSIWAGSLSWLLNNILEIERTLKRNRKRPGWKYK